MATQIPVAPYSKLWFFGFLELWFIGFLELWIIGFLEVWTFGGESWARGPWGPLGPDVKVRGARILHHK